ncbi:MAG: hypothetical protein QOH13_213, partial [Thermoleophilaceae bacterium]|nr:hypothetical protein [Thermoleophilaceae bacterium]
LLEEGLEVWPESPSLHYGFACWEALHGDKEQALDHLRRSIEREREVREWAQNDEDLLSLREEPEFKQLISG